MKKFCLALLCIVLALSSVSLQGFVPSSTAEASDFAVTLEESASLTVASVDAVSRVWQRTDKPVSDGKVSRTWMWGPRGDYGDNGFDVKYEAYAQSPDGQRQVFYFDKSRMEITNPDGDQSSQWYVTNGLLSRELITGKMQVGDNTFEDRWSAEIPVAGDPDDATAPTYATLSSLLAPVAESNSAVAETIDRAGNVGQDSALGSHSNYVYFVPETGHNVPSVFWDFLNSTGTIFMNGNYEQGKLVDPTFFATGFPITEAYWTKVKVAGIEKDVLVQAFERRVLTYTPSICLLAGQMGNVGRILLWRTRRRRPELYRS